jgi:outer membrane protein assembly factor BamB
MTASKPLRLWPGVASAALVVVGYVMVVSRLFINYGILVGLGGGVLILLWWMLFSRARWYERIAAIPVIAAAVYAQNYFVHPSIAGGAMGYMSYILAIPMLSAALVGWAAVSRRVSPGLGAAAVLGAAILGCLPWMLVRTGGMSGTGGADIQWRWSATPEARLLAQASDEPAAPPPAAAPPSAAAPSAATPSAATAPEAPKPAAPEAPKPGPAAPPPIVKTKPAEWPGFRGPERDGIVRGVTIAADWSTSPPAELWRRAVGPGWSSFAVAGDLIYTQEQRGEDEIVSSYRKSTGAPVWRHRDKVRFWESNAGAGPRGTPAVVDGRVYALGATGVLNSLDAATGTVIWSRNAAADTKVKIPYWGFSSSPLVVDDRVIVATGGTLAAYDVVTGNPRWSGPGSGGGGYSSPHLATIGGVPQILFLGGPGAIGVDPQTGKVLWQHKWEGGAIVQPAMTADGDVIISAISMSGGEALRRLAVVRNGDAWTAQEKWTTRGLKPYFNDYVIHKGHAYGFDGNILSCIDLADGARKWKGGRYGAGQLVLVADQDLLLLISEDGELALVSAKPDGFQEVARAPAIEGKTWNHPVLVRDVLLVRNDHEMVAFKLAATVASR